MKILYINTEKTWRGGERQSYYSLIGLKSEGVDVELLCLKETPLDEIALNENIPFHGTGNVTSAFFFLTQNGKKYDLIHSQSSKANKLAVLSKIFHRRPILYTRRVDFKQHGLKRRIFYYFTDKVIAVSEAIKQVLENSGIKEIAVIPDIVVKKNLNKKRALGFKRKLLGTKKHRSVKIIATTTALVGHKDPFTMVDAIYELARIRNDFIFLHFGNGYLLDETRARIKKLNLEDKYLLMGFMEDAEDFFSIFDVFAMSSKEEGLGSSVLDAFIYKVPVVSTNAGGLKETVFSRGLLSAVGDSKSFAQNLNRILNDTKLRKSLVAKAFREVNKIYSSENSAKEHIRIYKKLLKDRK